MSVLSLPFCFWHSLQVFLAVLSHQLMHVVTPVVLTRSSDLSANDANVCSVAPVTFSTYMPKMPRNTDIRRKNNQEAGRSSVNSRHDCAKAAAMLR